MASNEALAPGEGDIAAGDDVSVVHDAEPARSEADTPEVLNPDPAPPTAAATEPRTPSAPIIDVRARTTPRTAPRSAPRPAAPSPAAGISTSTSTPASGATRLAPKPEPVAEDDVPDLLAAVQSLRAHVGVLSLTLETQGVAEARRERESVINQLDDYMLPRLRRPDAPLLAVIGGSTGAGKSTLTNSLVRREVSRSGVLRPTTRSPVLVHHPADSGAFLSQRILPRLHRVTSEAPEPLQPIDPHAPRITGLRLVPHDGLTPGMGIIDAPDIDSLVETNRDLAVQLLAAADLWIFVTTAARYADAIPWDMLRQASERGVAVAVVLDRVPPEAMAELRVHLATRLRDRGLGGAPLFTIPEAQPVDGFLPEAVVAPLQQWLRRIAGSGRSRRMISDRSLLGVARSLPERAEGLAKAASLQAAGWSQLQRDLHQVFTAVRPQLLTALADGSLIGGEVLARWQELVADGEFIRRIDGAGPSLTERVTAVARPDDDSVRPLDGPVGDAVDAAVRAAVRSAREQVLAVWSERESGAALVAARAGELPPLNRRQIEVEKAVHDWRELLEEQVSEAVDIARDEGHTVDEDTARDVLFMVAVDETSDRAAPATGTTTPGTTPVTTTGTTTGTTPGATTPGAAGSGGSTVAAARRILATFLGEDRIRSLATDARADLAVRAAALLDEECERLESLLDVAAIDPGRARGLADAADAVDSALNGDPDVAPDEDDEEDDGGSR